MLSTAILITLSLVLLAAEFLFRGVLLGLGLRLAKVEYVTARRVLSVQGVLYSLEYLPWLLLLQLFWILPPGATSRVVLHVL